MYIPVMRSHASDAGSGIFDCVVILSVSLYLCVLSSSWRHKDSKRCHFSMSDGSQCRACVPITSPSTLGRKKAPSRPNSGVDEIYPFCLPPYTCTNSLPNTCRGKLGKIMNLPGACLGLGNHFAVAQIIERMNEKQSHSAPPFFDTLAVSYPGSIMPWEPSLGESRG
jgi:hypothetical protein